MQDHDREYSLVKDCRLGERQVEEYEIEKGFANTEPGECRAKSIMCVALECNYLLLL